MVYDINGSPISAWVTQLNDIVITSDLLYSGSISGVQSHFVTPSGKVWMIRENGSCTVTLNGVIQNTFTIDHSIGHANSTNYADGFAYVSDWTDGTLIHVFSVNETNNTMAYVKDIVVPIAYGRTDFFVFDGENQIISLSWDTTHSGDSDYMILGLWKKDSAGVYQNAYNYPVVGITVAQGMCLNGNRVYVLNNTAAYKHIGVVVVDLATGFQRSVNTQTGAILTLETEGITPVSETEFLVTAFNGSQFRLKENV